MKNKLIALCALLGIQFANSATDAETEAALDQVKTKVDGFAATSKAIREKLLGLAKKVGINFANDAEITDPVATIVQLEEKVTALETKLTGERDAARTQFANERTARITDEIALAVTSGRITDAEKATWDGRLKVEAQFANEVTAIRALKPVVKTTSVTITRGERKDTIDLGNPRQRMQFVNEILGEIATEKKLDPVRQSKQILNIARDRHPALFDLPHVQIKR